nr:hypothetical protein [uncultured Sphingomonas sp.]
MDKKSLRISQDDLGSAIEQALNLAGARVADLADGQVDEVSGGVLLTGTNPYDPGTTAGMIDPHFPDPFGSTLLNS